MKLRYPTGTPFLIYRTSQHTWTVLRYSKIDLVCGYRQILVHQDDIPKTVVITLFGFFDFLCMSFGLRNFA